MMNSKKYRTILFRLALIFMIIQLVSCYPDESLEVDQAPDGEPTSALEASIEQRFTEEYGIAIRYKFVDNFVQPGQRVAPAKEETVWLMLDFIEDFWIEPYLDVRGGEEFFRRYVPSEIVFLGGPIYNGDGTITLGLAEAGARITFTNVNAFDLSDTTWLSLQLRTAYHEFAHIVHQEFNLPSAFETITETGYTGPGSWFNLTDDDALQRGFVSPYATSSVNEDYAETVAFFLFDDGFYEQFIDEESDCVTADCVTENEGKRSISEKLATISDHYQKVTGLDLLDIREAIQSRLNDE